MASVSMLCFFLWISSVISIGHGCPELCTCSDKYGRHFAECSYKDLVEIPDGFPPNVTTLSLSANKISLIEFGSFDNVTQVTSLWMANNEILSIKPGTLAHLIQLRNFDISHNRIVDFPWEDLQNLTALQLLKMNHNKMVSLPKHAFFNLNDLRSLRLNNNRFTTIPEGTFDGLISLSHLQLYNNPFTCSCSMDWLRDWILKTTMTIPEQNSIVCATPEKVKGAIIVKLPESKCMSPIVTITSQPDIGNTTLYDGAVLMLTCETEGNPNPEIIWKIHTERHNVTLSLSTEEDDSAESVESREHTNISDKPIKFFHNGTLIISPISKKDIGNYSCLVTNEFGKAEDLVSVVIVDAPTPPPIKKLIETPMVPETKPSIHQPDVITSIFDTFHVANVERKDIIGNIPTLPPSAEVKTKYTDRVVRYPTRATKCGLNSQSQYISNHAFNGTLDDVKQYTFDFGIIALGVSETEAKVRLNPLLLPKDKTSIQLSTSEEFHSVNKEFHKTSEVSRRVISDGLYLCVTADHRHSAVQWSRIEDGVNTYLFRGLRPGTNYSLCLTYRGEDCEVQVLFATRKRVPDLLIIISVSICLLTVSTVPLLGATCFHLVYKYRTKTYKLIMKAKDQYHIERNLGANFNIRAPNAESQRKIYISEIDEGAESVEGDREGDVEGSIATESFTLSQYRGNLDDCEVGSEYSDRLPLGAEAVNIRSNYK
ncbi:immunoglobulin superfamily containing leucine-rich repeat protein 2-like [Hypomesus transpacificus]|uniref:immunoglobulin superfamily containing leucine-rich repeat protein 2-like n=1 Tax=Hypomesus transpacificus TaxID=137520 RepID=UPI001F078A4E|nr:immunoglobulin superfamily containing leucine-rich repeat protein 2-like [Hypomesus transpacificus]